MLNPHQGLGVSIGRDARWWQQYHAYLASQPAATLYRKGKVVQCREGGIFNSLKELRQLGQLLLPRARLC